MVQILQSGVTFAPVIAPATSAGVDASKVKQQLVSLGIYDAVEASLSQPLDPATITWNTGGPVALGGPLSNVIARILNYNAVQMSLFLLAASSNVT